MFAETAADNSRWCLVTSENLGFTRHGDLFYRNSAASSGLFTLTLLLAKQTGTG